MGKQMSHYRVQKRGDGSLTMQGAFSGVEDIRAYLMKHNAEHGANDYGTFRIEKFFNGKWMFESNIKIEPQAGQAAGQ